MKNLRLLFTFSFFAVCLFFGGSESVSAQETQLAKNTVEKEKTVSPVEPNPAENASANVSDSKTISTETKYNPTARVGVQTAQTLPLTLNDAIRKALENNNDIEVARSDVKIAESNLRSLEGIYDLVFTISPAYSRSSQTGAADSTITNATATNNLQTDFSVARPIRFGGGSYSTFFNTRRTNGILRFFFQTDPNTGQTVPVPILTSQNSSSFGTSFTQPILRGRKIDNNRRQIRIQRKRISQSDADFRRQTIEIISQVQQGYWDLVFALRDQQNRVANLNLSKENLRRIEAQISAGSAAPLARAEVETELANRESDLILATQQVEISENRLKQLLLHDPSADEWTSQYIPTDSPVFSTDTIDLNLAMKDAMDNRPELRRLKLESEVNKIDIEYFKDRTKPQLDFNSTISLDGLANSQNATGLPTYLTGGYGQSLQNLFRSDALNYSAGVTISFPLRNQTAKADLATARLQQERIGSQTRSQEQLVVAEVRNAVQAVESSRQRVFAARRARVNAEKQLEGERKLFENGRSTTFLLFQRENTLTNARNAEIRSETDYNKALADLQRATSTTFRANGVEVDSPMKDDQ